jgi:hypothetical protein
VLDEFRDEFLSSRFITDIGIVLEIAHKLGSLEDTWFAPVALLWLERSAFGESLEVHFFQGSSLPNDKRQLL